MWQDIENLLKSLGTDISEGNSSRVRIELSGERAVFHRPHPEKVTDKGAVKAMRKFLENAVEYMMNHKGFIGTAEYDDEAHIFSGKVINTHKAITFQGTSVEEIENEFRTCVDDYLDWRRKDGTEPEKPYSEKFNVRLSQLFHSEVAVAAKKLNMSLNSFVEKSLKDELSALHLTY